MSRCRHGLSDWCPACERLAEDRDYESADPMTAADWDELEAGPLWNWPAEL